MSPVFRAAAVAVILMLRMVMRLSRLDCGSSFPPDDGQTSLVAATAENLPAGRRLAPMHDESMNDCDGFNTIVAGHQIIISRHPLEPLYPLPLSVNMSIFGNAPLQAVSDDVDAWNNLSDSTKILYNEALEIVNSSSGKTNRLREIFIDKTLDVNKNLVPCYGETLLYKAVQSENVEMVETLLELGADPNKENAMDGETPLESLEILDCEEYHDRNETQEAILKLLQDASGQFGGKGGRASQDDRLRDEGEEFWDAYKQQLWAIGQDPEEVEALQDRVQANPGDIFSVMFLRMLAAQLEEAQNKYSPDELAREARGNRFKFRAKQEHEKIGKENSALIMEAYDLLDTTESDELKVSPDALLRRIQEIYSTPGVDVNVPSPDGHTLLMKIILNYALSSMHPDTQVELVRFLLFKGADPNLEDSIGETAQDWLDSEVEYEDLTLQEKEIVRLLKEAGALIRVRDDNGRVVGKRGEGISRHEQARQRLGS